MKGILCFDMDGTIANLYGVPDWLPKLRAYDPSPYREAAPLVDMVALSLVLNMLKAKGYEVHIISWLSKESPAHYSRKVRYAKHAWSKRHGFPADKEHYFKYGTDKQQAIKNAAVPCIIFDDDSKVRETWKKGAAIDPAQVDIIGYLMELLEK